MHKLKTLHFTPVSSTAWKALVLQSALCGAPRALLGLGCSSAG